MTQARTPNAARRIVDAALELEAEGLSPDEAWDAACERVPTLAPADYRFARRVLEALQRRGSRAEALLPPRDARGRFRRCKPREPEQRSLF